MRVSLIKKKFSLYLLLNYANAFAKNQPMDVLKMSQCNKENNKRLNKENVYIIIHHYIYYI